MYFMESVFVCQISSDLIGRLCDETSVSLECFVRGEKCYPAVQDGVTVSVQWLTVEAQSLCLLKVKIWLMSRMYDVFLTPPALLL
jgi:hypothetical protein